MFYFNASRSATAALLAAGCLFLSSCGKPDQSTPAARSMENRPVPDTYKVKFETTKGDFVIAVNKDWAPLGAERFYQLVTSGFFDNSKFFRAVPGFVVQFGLAADPATQRNAPGEMPDDPVKESNLKGTITFATRGPNSRTTQVFINLANNPRLDQMGFSPFGSVVEGMSVVEQLFGGYGDSGPDQNMIKMQGNSYIEASFPKIDGMKKVSIVTE